MTPTEEALTEIETWYLDQKYPEAYQPHITTVEGHNTLTLVQEGFTGSEIIAIGHILTKHGATWYIIADDNRDCEITARFPPGGKR